MGINRLLIDSRIQGFWHSHTKTSQDAGTGRRGAHTTGPGMPACSGMCSSLMTVAAVSALVECIGWLLQLQWLHGWPVHSIDVDHCPHHQLLTRPATRVETRK